MFSRLSGALLVPAIISFTWQAAADGKDNARSLASQKNGETSSRRTLTTQLTYKATIPEVPSGTKTLNLWLPLPFNSEWQSVDDIVVEGTEQYKLTQDRQYGNRMVYIMSENPKTPVAITVKFVVKRKEVHVLASSSHGRVENGSGTTEKRWSRYLKPDAHVPVGGRFGEIAREVASDKKTVLDKARALFEHVVATMQYDYKKESPRLGEGDVPFVCDYKKGNCSDLHSYYISLARSLGIPAVLEYGFPLAGIPLPNPLPKEGKIGGYHCWTWIYQTDIGWMPLDASDARRWLDSNRPDIKEYLFGSLVLERSAVAFSRGRDITLEPPQKADPLNNFIYPYAEADGKPVKVNWDLSYRLIGIGDDISRAVHERGRPLTYHLSFLHFMEGSAECAKFR